MARQLCQQGPGHPLYAEGEAGVLDGALVAQFGEHIDKGTGLFLCKALHHRVYVRGGVAELGGAGHGALGVGRIS